MTCKAPELLVSTIGEGVLLTPISKAMKTESPAATSSKAHVVPFGPLPFDLLRDVVSSHPRIRRYEIWSLLP